MTPEDAALCERLKVAAYPASIVKHGDIMDQAAAAIERLSAENEALINKVLDAVAAYLIDTYGPSYGLDNEIDRARIKATLKGADQ